MPKDGWRLSVAYARASGRAVPTEPHSAVKVSTACPSSLGYSRMPLFMYRCPYSMYRCPYSGYRVQGFVAEDTSEDGHIYEPVTMSSDTSVNPHTGVDLGEKAE